MTLDRVQERIINYKKALDKLQRIIDEPEVNDYRLDALIQRFEFTYELA
ncbi:MAG: nucleotidyltransferase, partial [Syntrophomonadaceae bacterium]|nr:nucleotidyltransferase [Syntrophomonadaceae bacterium]